jgi:hypothetical protein
MVWQSVFELSRASGATYGDDIPPHTNWNWPKETWLQRKRRELREVRELQKEESPWPIKQGASER